MTESTFSALQGHAQALSRMAYSDINALRRVRGNDAEALEQAAAQFESMFIDIWLRSMREANKAFGEGNYLSSSTVEMHQEMLDHQWALHVAQAGGVGLKDVLVRQLAGQVEQPSEATPPAPVGAISRSRSRPHAPERTVEGQAGHAESRSGDRSYSGVGAGAVEARPQGFKRALFDSAQSFVERLEPVVRRIAAASGLNPIAMLAQAALETGWGAKVPHDGDGRPSYNLFGVKAHGWDGPSVDVTTLEHQFGRFVRKVDRFRAYEDAASALEDYVSFLTNNPRYARALEVAQDPAAFADALQEAGYATDPGYADKLKALQRQIAAMLGVSQEA